MSKINHKQFFFSVGVFCFIVLAIAFSCSENESDESPKHFSATLSNKSETDNSLSTPGAEIKIQSIGQKIPNETAKRWIGNHSEKNPKGIKYYLFGKEAFDRLLNQPNVAGIRLCNGVNDSGNSVIVMVAVNDKNEVLDDLAQEGYEDASMSCPPQCPQ